MQTSKLYNVCMYRDGSIWFIQFDLENTCPLSHTTRIFNKESLKKLLKNYNDYTFTCDMEIISHCFPASSPQEAIENTDRKRIETFLDPAWKV